MITPFLLSPQKRNLCKRAYFLPEINYIRKNLDLLIYLSPNNFCN